MRGGMPIPAADGRHRINLNALSRLAYNALFARRERSIRQERHPRVSRNLSRSDTRVRVRPAGVSTGLLGVLCARRASVEKLEIAHVTVSVGAATMHKGKHISPGHHELCPAADRALYQAKNGGTNRRKEPGCRHNGIVQSRALTQFFGLVDERKETGRGEVGRKGSDIFVVSSGRGERSNDGWRETGRATIA